jgi:predicted GNAT family acetyltransferase
MSGSREVRVEDNPNELRYELRIDGELAGEIRYRTQPGAVVLVHTDIEPSLEGQGLGAVLVGEALADIRARGLLVVPFCPFVAAYIRDHPEFADLVTTEQ